MPEEYLVKMEDSSFYDSRWKAHDVIQRFNPFQPVVVGEVLFPHVMMTEHVKNIINTMFKYPP
jgi:hypothetical protein